jgi:hypothetical protein
MNVAEILRALNPQNEPIFQVTHPVSFALKNVQHPYDKLFREDIRQRQLLSPPATTGR